MKNKEQILEEIHILQVEMRKFASHSEAWLYRAGMLKGLYFAIGVQIPSSLE